MSKSKRALSKPQVATDFMDREVWTAAEVAVYLRLHSTTVTERAKAGDIPGKQIGSAWRFSRTRIIRLLEEGESTLSA